MDGPEDEMIAHEELSLRAKLDEAQLLIMRYVCAQKAYDSAVALPNSTPAELSVGLDASYDALVAYAERLKSNA